MKRLKSILSKVLEISPSRIDETTSPNNSKNWDSYNSLLMISEIEEEFKVKFTMAEIIKIKNVKDIKELLVKKGIKLHE